MAEAAAADADRRRRRRPGIVGVEIRKRGQRGGCFYFGQAVEPHGEPRSHTLLKLPKPKREEQIPRAKRVERQMDQRMRFDADAVKNARNVPCEGGRRTSRFQERCTDDSP